MRQEVKQCLSNILKEEGELTTSGVLDRARPVDSPLHAEFEWDDSVAAEQFRLNQSRTLIKRFSVTIVEPEEKLFNVPKITVANGESGEGVYKRAKDIVNDPADFAAAVRACYARLASAEDAIAGLRRVAHGRKGDAVALLTIAMEGMKTAQNAVKQLH